ncbi:hypothetical protein HN807_06845 [Candidatus Bathyarchaeota archaeon]|jgi:hypothetical protein|nr:hypothetical protein [Candidatus Bathyarchaeota archaeon]MBT4424230.1 hypothetical protein [Candidatus Bathyarchaeota archaeon]MBT7187613.1 hypothetical protein [Candidatus Bathyarchaeota archaeon]MBT7346783.1 hypothetical protein [Candidatus Bathyarchaeota archaeon]
MTGVWICGRATIRYCVKNNIGFIKLGVIVYIVGKTRSSALIQIMQIEDEIKRVINGKEYINIRQYVQVLKDLSGNAILQVENPDDMGKMVRLRKNSEEAKKYLVKYEAMLNEFDVQLLNLRKRKQDLNSELFGKRN